MIYISGIYCVSFTVTAMIDLHTHTIFSDGVLIPFELVRRAEAIGYRTIAITDHADSSNLAHVIPNVLKAALALKGNSTVNVIPGVELTHIPPALMSALTKEARSLGAALVVVHGETLVEPVMPGTNRAAIEAGVDVLAHPGLISDDDVRLAAERGVALEITARKGHSLTNGHVAAKALQYNAQMVIDTDAHAPGDLITLAFARNVLRGAGLDERQIENVLLTSGRVADNALRRIHA